MHYTHTRPQQLGKVQVGTCCIRHNTVTGGSARACCWAHGIVQHGRQNSQLSQAEATSRESLLVLKPKACTTSHSKTPLPLASSCHWPSSIALGKSHGSRSGIEICLPNPIRPNTPVQSNPFQYAALHSADTALEVGTKVSVLMELLYSRVCRALRGITPILCLLLLLTYQLL